ncbi:hypothetical protein BDI4_1120014 [Burkholderia diffusa]|nr:hypothetical protein BDI4_1120014 [Burkholderia diffusa]
MNATSFLPTDAKMPYRAAMLVVQEDAVVFFRADSRRLV